MQFLWVISYFMVGPSNDGQLLPMATRPAAAKWHQAKPHIGSALVLTRNSVRWLL
jgi:hypothetical protein